MKLKGHETFHLREGWIYKGITAVNDNPNVFSENFGADDLGVGSNMAKAIRYWLKAGNFITEKVKKGAYLSEVAELILKQDEYLEDDFWLWIFHCNLCCNKDLATSWYLYFNELEGDEFSKEELFDILMVALIALPKTKKIAARSLKDDINVLFSMYLWEKIDNYDPEDNKISPFAKLGLLKKQGNKYKKTQPEINIQVKTIFYYLLQKYFEENEKATNDFKNSISIEKIIYGKKLPGRILNLGRVAINEILDELANKKLITVNRTAGLDMVYQESTTPAIKVLENYYLSISKK